MNEFINSCISDISYECYRNPTAYEVKFGEGALHWRSFTIFEIGRNKKGQLKRWFVSKDDGLRYYRPI